MRRLHILFLACFLVPIMGTQAQKKKKNKKPNVLFIISDQHKQTFSGAYGHDIIKTPNIDALAKNGVTFENAYAPAPVCAPTRAAIVTGMYPYANGAIYHKAPVINANGKEVRKGSGFLRSTGYHDDIKTIAEVFKKDGYITASPGKMHVHGELQKNVDPAHPEGNDMGWDVVNTRYYTHFPGGHYEDEVGKDAYHRYRQILEYKKYGGSQDLNPQLKPSLVEDHEDNFDMVVARKAVEFIDERGKDDESFFLHVGFEKPHLPLTTLHEYYDLYDQNDFEFPETVNDWYKSGKYPWVQNWVHHGLPKNKPEQAKRVMAAYAACITEMDEMIGRIVTALEKNGLADNTIIIYTSDHGEHMWEHGLRGKHNMYDAAIKVPFIVSYPKALPQGTRNETLVSLVDVMPTVAELIGADVPEEVQGVSLVSTSKNGKTIKNRTVFAEYRAGDYKAFPKQKDLPSRMMRKGNMKYIYTHGVIDQLYDVEKDPNERENLALNPAYQSLLEEMKFQTLVEWRFDKYSEMKVDRKGNTLQWDACDYTEDYTIFYAKNNNPLEAKVIKKDLADLSFEVEQKGYYWVMAQPKLTRTTPHYGEKVPVWIAAHTFDLPISNAVEVKKNLSK
ncbi:sulfatase-like hydrolase/transferase [Flammeovirga sp. SubArs3]|uniref:sulfatase family protein n=1 Tax=Flammeovirga sp. SubArs3 TaxID=2995316 RepID=UPI00248CDBD1|nr:sulfatase-like hydrolase/transferase [Flammeovirga sp. SubArs3]